MDQFEQQMEDDLFGSTEPTNPVNDDDDDYVVSNDDDDYQDEPSSTSDDFMERYLRSKGIDKENVLIYSETGDKQIVNFDDLSNDEKLDLLQASDESPITDEELQTLNYLRENGLDMREYTELVQNQAIQDYLAQSQMQNFQIDSLNDDEVFVLDMINRFGDDMSNEEIDAELERAKQDEDSFNKKVNLIRSQYKNQEAAARDAQQQQYAYQQQKDFEEFTQSLAVATDNLNEIQGVELEPEDKQQIMDFLLTTDAANRTGFSKVLSDPDAIVKLAWFYLYGDQTFNATVDYFKNELAKARRAINAPRSVNKHDRSNRSGEADIYGLNSVFK